MKIRKIEELINTEDPGWVLVQDWISEAKNSVEVLPVNKEKSKEVLYQTQVTTRSPMGGIIYETGGLLIDKGWIRILGSGSEKMKRNLAEWNKGKTYEQFGETPSILLIGDDVIGGFFALNGGGLGQDLGKVYYLSPDLLEWESLEISYSQFIYWTLTGDLEEFYKGLRWGNWEREIEEINGDKVMSFFPYLWTEYEDISELSRKAISIEEIWTFQIETINQLRGKD